MLSAKRCQFQRKPTAALMILPPKVFNSILFLLLLSSLLPCVRYRSRIPPSPLGLPLQFVVLPLKPPSKLRCLGFDNGHLRFPLIGLSLVNCALETLVFFVSTLSGYTISFRWGNYYIVAIPARVLCVLPVERWNPMIISSFAPTLPELFITERL